MEVLGAIFGEDLEIINEDHLQIKVYSFLFHLYYFLNFIFFINFFR
jgi:hypothetical protein